MLTKNSDFQNGQSLFELIVSVGIVALVLVGIISLSIQAISNSTYSKNRTLAARYTQEASEWLRAQRDADWDEFITNASPGGRIWCLKNLSWGAAGPCSPSSQTIANLFIRQANLVYDPLVDANSVEVTVTTSWSGTSGDHQSRSVTTLTNWKAVK